MDSKAKTIDTLATIDESTETVLTPAGPKEVEKEEGEVGAIAGAASMMATGSGKKKSYRAVVDYKNVVSTLPKFETKVMQENTDNTLAAGLVVDFSKFEEDDTDAKQAVVLRALSDLKITDRPCMVIDLAAVRDLELVVDGKDVEETEEEKANTQPCCARIVIPASQIVDIKLVQPAHGASIIRCNGCIPTFRWFQAANLLLHERKTPGRLIPFPLEQENGTTTYQAIRVSAEEFRKYQELLTHCVEQDGVEKGFFIAAKFAYQVLSDRGCSEITYKQVGNMVTDIVIMGKSFMRGVLILNSKPEDFDDFKKVSLFF